MKPNSLTNTEKDRIERALYRAIDGVQFACDQGFGSYKTEQAFNAVRDLMREVMATPTRTRKTRQF